MRRSALIVAPLLALALVAGCDQGDDLPGDGPDRSSADPTSEGKDTDSGDGSLESCVVGDWEADDDTLAAMGLDDYAELGADMNADIVFTFEKGGDFDWSFDISGSSTQQGAPYSMDMNISLIGTWKVLGSDQMNLTLDDANGSMTIEMAGQTQTEDLTGEDLDMTDADDAIMTVTCTGSTLAMTDDSSETITLKRQ